MPEKHSNIRDGKRLVWHTEKLLMGYKTIKAVQFRTMPEPDEIHETNEQMQVTPHRENG